LVGTQNQTPDAAAQASRIADRQDAEAGANTTGMPAAAGASAEAPGSFDSFGNPVAAGSAAATSADPTGLAQAQQDVNAGKPSPAAPAAGKKLAKVDPGTVALQKFLIANGFQVGSTGADGRFGPNTKKAYDAAKTKLAGTPQQKELENLMLKAHDMGFDPSKVKPAAGQAAQPAAAPAGNPAANQTVSTAARTGVDLGAGTAGGGRGGQGGPTAAQAAQAGNPAVAKLDAEIKRFSAKNNMTIAANQKYVAGLEAKKAAASGQTAQPAAASGQAAQPAAAASKVNPMPDPNIRTGTIAQRDEWMSKYGKTHNQDGTPKSSNQAAPLTQSIQNEDDAILERIRTALFR
jgi:hypothetical protein